MALRYLHPPVLSLILSGAVYYSLLFRPRSDCAFALTALHRINGVVVATRLPVVSTIFTRSVLFCGTCDCRPTFSTRLRLAGLLEKKYWIIGEILGSFVPLVAHLKVLPLLTCTSLCSVRYQNVHLSFRTLRAYLDISVSQHHGVSFRVCQGLSVSASLRLCVRDLHGFVNFATLTWLAESTEFIPNFRERKLRHPRPSNTTTEG